MTCICVRTYSQCVVYSRAVESESNPGVAGVGTFCRSRSRTPAVSHASFATVCWKTVQIVKVCCVGPTIFHERKFSYSYSLFKSELDFVIHYTEIKKWTKSKIVNFIFFETVRRRIQSRSRSRTGICRPESDSIKFKPTPQPWWTATWNFSQGLLICLRKLEMQSFYISRRSLILPVAWRMHGSLDLVVYLARCSC